MDMLAFYVSEKKHHVDTPMHEWLMEQAKALGVSGGSAFRAIAGYGRHGKMHEEFFFELAGELAIRVEFIIDEALADRLLEKVKGEKKNIFYVRHKVESGVI